MLVRLLLATAASLAAGCDPSSTHELARPSETAPEVDDPEPEAEPEPEGSSAPASPEALESPESSEPPVGDAPDSGEAVEPPEAAHDQVPVANPAIRIPEGPELIKHVVVSRESIHQIAARYAVPMSALRRWNGLGDDVQRPKPRSTLKVWARRVPPPRERIEYTVVAGDTWGQISRAHGVASTDVRAYNVSRVGRSIDPDEVLQLWIDPVVLADIQGAGPDEELRRGAYGVGSPADGRLVNAVQIPEDPAWSLHFPSSAWGTTFAVGRLIAGIRAWRASGDYGGVLRIGSMSRQRGGEFGSHRSHQTGRDVDIRLPLREDTPQGIAVDPRRVDWAALWRLTEALIDTGGVDVIFFDYKLQRKLARAAEELGVPPQRIDERLQWPIGSKAVRGVIRHEPGHTEHIHVRFRCGPNETECSER